MRIRTVALPTSCFSFSILATCILLLAASVSAQTRRASAHHPMSFHRGSNIMPTVTCGSGTDNWTGKSADNQWTTAGNWSAGIPISTSKVCIASSFTSAITVGTLAAANQTISSLTSGAPLSITAGPLTVSGTATLGDLQISAGTLTFNGTTSLATFEQSAGTLTGTGSQTVTGMLTWSGGTMSGTGTTNASGGMTLSGEPFLDTRTLNNSKTATWTGYAFLMLNGSILNNQSGATWNHEGDTQIEFDGGTTPTFNNAGTFEKTTGTNTTGGGVGANIVFNNTGSVMANSGTLLIEDAGTCTTSCAGSWSVIAGSTLELGSGGTAALSGPLSGAGMVDFGTSGTINSTGSYNVTGGTTAGGDTVNFLSPGTVTATGPLTVNVGTMSFQTGKALTFPSMTQSGGTLTGTDTMTVTGMLTWSGGTMSGTGTTNAKGGMTLSGEPFLDTRTLNNSKTANWTGYAFLMLNGSIFNNLAGATWNQEGDTVIEYDGGATPTFNNAGTFEKTTGTNTTGGGFYSGIIVNNSGTVIAKSGILQLGSAYTQTGGSTLLEGGTLAMSGSSPLAEKGGSLLGGGTITGDINNSAGELSPSLLSPKLTTGTLAISGSGVGNLTEGSAGTLLFNVGGNTTGKFDVLSVSGTASLAGTAVLCLINSYKPAIGSTFPVMTYASESGTFSKIQFGWSMALGGTSAVATYHGAPSDGFSPAALAFPSQLLSTTSSPMTETLTNVGQVALTIGSITLAGTDSKDFTLTANTCGSSLAAGASCTMTVTFTPSALGKRSATITVVDNACGSPHVLALTGGGTEVTMSPSPVNFGTQTVGTTSAPMTITLTNHGASAVTVTTATLTGADKGDFKIQTNGCKSIAASGGTCTITVTFTPAASGARTGTLSVTDSDKGSPQTDALEGTGG